MGDVATIRETELIYEPNDGLAVLVVTDDAVRREALGRLAAGHGARLVSSATLAEAPHRIPAAGAHVVLADLRGSDAGAADCVMVALAARPAGETLAIVDAEALDHAFSRLGAGPVELLVAPTPEDLRAAASALIGAWTGVREGAEASARTLAQLSEDVGRIARTLATLSVEVKGGSAASRVGTPADALVSVRAILRARRLRDQFFDRDLFADPAWDMLLDLAAARIEGRRVAVSSLCIAAAVPPTTALRWIATMTERGLLRRQADPDDGRRVFITLSEQAAAAMSDYLEARRRALGA